MTRATILIPTHEHPLLLPWAIDCARHQTESDIDILVVCDGADRRSVEEALSARFDPRVMVEEFPKGERHGEGWRHLALESARGEIVCYLSDDDLWFPDHVAQMLAIRGDGLFHTLPTRINQDGTVERLYGSRDTIASGHNYIPLSAMGHTTEAYRRLPTGWSPAPIDTHTDLFMWSKFIAADSPLDASPVPTVIHFPTHQRQDWTPDRRRQELMAWWFRLMRDPLALRRELLDEAQVAP